MQYPVVSKPLTPAKGRKMDDLKITHTQPYEMTASEAAAAIADRHISSEELTKSCLDHIFARNDDVKAWCYLDPDQALRDAKELDKVLFHDGACGELHGVPFGVKDMIDTSDFPTTNNSPIYFGHQPAQDAQVVRVMKAAGALVLGKTDTVEFAAGGRKALTRHPKDPTRTPGGSSSGSGAAVGDKQVPLALGTQTGGSHIRPASFNGIYALKPTHGLVAWPGARHCSPTLDTLGWYGRTPDDLSLVGRAFHVWGMDDVPDIQVRGLKVGVAKTQNWDKAEPATIAAIDRAQTLLEQAGAEVFDLTLPKDFEQLNHDQRVVMYGEGRVQFLPDYLEHGEKLHIDFRLRVENSEKITPERLLKALDRAAACRPVFDALFGADLDVVLTPSSCGEAPVGPHETTGDAVMNSMWTLLHMPCVNIPGAVGPNGLPVGVTLVGPRFSDAKLVGLAKMAASILDPELGIG
jgi:Asp-tRNA(Asn)/Glu-tRNA(Gln) amidotransferase A subunit family amidase